MPLKAKLKLFSDTSVSAWKMKDLVYLEWPLGWAIRELRHGEERGQAIVPCPLFLPELVPFLMTH